MSRPRTIFLLAGAAVLAGCGVLPSLDVLFPRTTSVISREIEEFLNSGGVQRRYRVYVPSFGSTSAVGPQPLVLAFHGWGGNAAGMSRLTGLDDLAERYGFIVAYPEGVNGNWCDGRPNINPTVDDVAFVRTLIDKLESTYRVDPKRIYATGLSNGGHMANRLAIEMSERIAAVAPICAELSAVLSATTVAGRPVPILIIAGDSDPIAPYSGGTVGGSFLNRGEVLSANATTAFWVKRNHAAATPVITHESDRDAGDGTRVQRTSYAAPANGTGADVVLLTVQRGGHTWPGGQQYLPELLIGRTSRDISASEVVWLFFSQHSLP